METGPDTPEAVRDRAVSLVEYLLAVRALLERPARTVPATDAFWQADLPTHPAVAIGPGDTTGPWLRVGRPTAPAAPVIPPAFVKDLVWDLSYVGTPRRGAEGRPTLTSRRGWRTSGDPGQPRPPPRTPP